ncbi:hypothetical protein MHI37_19640 [Paenibacillus sp. FSL H8-0548]|uniref:hypothetical protein n=1 Tax=Paenibacillus sp. FSL H8-0548 TaxID=1920422 RepID=UPI00315AED32
MLKAFKKLSLSTIAAVIVLAAAPIPANAAAAPLLKGIVSIDGNHALDDKGVLWTWNEETYEAVPILEEVKTISEGNTAVKKDGTVWTWGRKIGNVTGPDGKIVYFNTFDQPTKVEGLSGAVDVSGNYVLKADGTVWSVSGGCEYQLPNESCAAEASVEAKLRPGRIGELKNIVAIADGGTFPLALGKDGSLWIWGQDRYGDSFLPAPLVDRKDAKPTNFKEAASISSGLAISSSWDIYTIDRFAIYGVASPEFNVAKLAPNVAAVSGARGNLTLSLLC